MSNETKTNHYAYYGPLGEVVRHGRTFFARKDGFLIATHDTFEEAMAALAWKGRVKATSLEANRVDGCGSKSRRQPAD